MSLSDVERPVEEDPYADTWWERWHDEGAATLPDRRRAARHRRHGRHQRRRVALPRPRAVVILACALAFVVSFTVDVLVHPWPDPFHPVSTGEGN